MHLSHVPSQLPFIHHTMRLVGTRLVPLAVPLTATWRAVDGVMDFAAGTRGEFTAIAEGDVWGRNRDQAWFHLTGAVPTAWAGRAVVAWVDLGTEALVYTAAGRVVQGLNTGAAWDDTAWRNSRPFVHLHDACKGGEAVELWIDAACWAHPGAVELGGPMAGALAVAGTPLGQANRLRLAVFENAAWELFCDFEVLLDLVKALPETSARRAKVLRALVAAAEKYAQSDDFEATRAVLAPVLAKPASASDLVAIAVGHGHLDTAWLWDYATGRRKIARTAANQLRLIERFPGYVFGCSAAAHYRWLQEDHPELWARVRGAINAGTWEILGPMWVEPDVLVPNGEALIRQCLHGTRYFRDHFGKAPTAAWLPDTFGYVPSLPQILAHCGSDTLFTTKIAWNPCHPPRHHSFRWVGHDGTEVVVHYPPDGAYEASLLPSSLIAGQGNYAEKAETDMFVTAFGYGDGGGGPAERHLMRARRGADLEGMPRIRLGAVATVQAHLRERRADLPAFSDELYLEQHQGTLTTHGDVKSRNRRLEQTLAATEILLAHAPASWPAAELDRLWKILLINQFHDVLPGTSIAEVYAEVVPMLDGAVADCVRLAAAVVGDGETGDLVLFNSLAVAWEGVIELPGKLAGRGLRTRNGAAVLTQREGSRTVAWVVVPAMGFLELVAAGDAPDAVLAGTSAPILDNGRIRAVFDPATGLLTSLNGVLPANGGGNALSLYGDNPSNWDAWNLELGYRNVPSARARCTACRLIIDGPVRQVIEHTATIGVSTIDQRISLARRGSRVDFSTVVDWRETHQFLRVAFPTNIRADHASYHIQHGYVERPTRARTEIDTTRVEYSAHHYVDLSVAGGAGLALLNDGKYGQIVDGSTIDLGLLRSPVFPDPGADRGRNEFTYALVVHDGGFPNTTVFSEADRLNRAPFQWQGKRAPAARLPITLESEHITVEALKRAEDGNGWIVRLCNRSGRAAIAALRAEIPLRLTPCNGLEDAIGSGASPQSGWEIPLAPFQVLSWRCQ